MTYEEKLAISREAYKEIKEVMIKWELPGYWYIPIDECPVNFFWDECIQVEDELFHGHQLRENPKK